MRIAVDVEQLEGALNSLIGKPLSAAVVTRRDQSCISLDFGRMTCMKGRAKEEPHGSEEDEHGPPIRMSADGITLTEGRDEQCAGELTLEVWCNWRVEMGETQIVCGSLDSTEEGRPILSGIREMMEDTVVDVSLNSFLDLLVIFSSGKRFRLFCDQSGHENNDDCYRLSTFGGEAYGVISGLIERVGGWGSTLDT